MTPQEAPIPRLVMRENPFEWKQPGYHGSIGAFSVEIFRCNVPSCGCGMWHWDISKAGVQKDGIASSYLNARVAVKEAWTP